jgi:hypothetical protein
MIFPKGQTVYKDLNTSFTNIGELLLDLKANGFTGYVQVSFSEYEGILLLDSGNIVNAVAETEGRRKTGQEAVSNVTARAKDRNGAISVYGLSGEMVINLAGMVESEVVYKDLSTEFTSLDKLIAKLQSEEHTGYVEVVMKDDHGAGLIFLQAGQPIENILSINGDTVSGAVVLRRIIETASAVGAVFNVYQVTAEEASAESTQIMASFDLPQLLEVWGEIISSAERVTDGLSSEGRFVNTFKDVLMERADDFPFLDPFAAEFEYRDGQVAFHGESVKNFSQGLGECLNATIGRLAAETPRVDLTGMIKTELQAVRERHAGAIEKFALEATLPEFLA